MPQRRVRRSPFAAGHGRQGRTLSESFCAVSLAHPPTTAPDGRDAAVVAATGTSDDPEGYGEAVARDLFPDVLTYVVGSRSTYGFAARNGRAQADNAPEAMLSLVTNMAIPSGLKPSVTQKQRASHFPYVVPA